MGAAWALLALGVGAARASADCRDAYRPEHAALWEIEEAACAAGGEAPELLRAGQAAFQRSCSALFQAEVDKGRLPPTTVLAFCAQGVPGRRRLRADLGLAPEATPAAEGGQGPPGETPRPGEGGMGPLPLAVEATKAKWGGGCLSAMGYSWTPTRLNRDRGDKWSGKLEPYVDSLEGYQYFFYLPSKSASSLTVSFADDTDGAFAILKERLKGPEFEEAAKNTGNDCLARVEVDAGKALQLAEKAGVAADPSEVADRTAGSEAQREKAGVTASLVSPGTWLEFYAKCSRGLSRGMTYWCAGPLTKSEQRRLARRELWVVEADGKTAFIDAAKGELLFVKRLTYRALPLGGAPSSGN